MGYNPHWARSPSQRGEVCVLTVGTFYRQMIKVILPSAGTGHSGQVCPEPRDRKWSSVKVIGAPFSRVQGLESTKDGLDSQALFVIKKVYFNLDHSQPTLMSFPNKGRLGRRVGGWRAFVCQGRLLSRYITTSTLLIITCICVAEFIYCPSLLTCEYAILHSKMHPSRNVL